MDDISVIILAAGNGTRMKSQKSKVLHEICGKSMIAHIIKKAQNLSNDIHIVLGYQFDEVKNAVLAKFPSLKIHAQDTQNFPGTAGAVKAALNTIKSPRTLIICGDMPLIESKDLFTLKTANENGTNIALAAFNAQNPSGYGRVITNGQNVLKIVEEKDATTDEKAVRLCNSGAYCVDTAVLSEIIAKIKRNEKSGEFYLTDMFEIAIKSGLSVKFCEVSEENFMGVNDKIALANAEILMQKRINENFMKNGVIMHLPHTILIDADAVLIGECEIWPNVVIKGPCVIENCVIKSGCVIENSTLKNSDFGPNAHIRPGCVIKNTHIGNFVELKNATLNGVKAGHLSYLGDCEIKSGTNVGCGTITCNFDGKKKHRTIIGENVFIGSDTQLIAPLEIADNTIIAAGSSVTKNSQNGDLIIARSRQINKSGYFYKIFGQDNEK